MGIVGKLFGKYLLLTNTVSCGVMMAAGDVIQQSSEHWKKNYFHKYFPSGSSVMAASLDDDELTECSTTDSPDTFYEHNYSRTKNMMMVGLLQGPFHHCFYNILERVVPGKAASAVLKKTLLDQSIASPTCLGIFFVGLGVLEGRKLQDILDEMKLKLVDTWKVDCSFWPPTQCINFLFVPLQYRVLYINFMTMVYDIFLSYMKYDANFE